jgi:two-component system chemotaxis response regulator CheY
MEVLVVEDMKSMRGMVSSMLKLMGFTDILQAEHGGEAWKLLNKHCIDLLLGYPLGH